MDGRIDEVWPEIEVSRDRLEMFVRAGRDREIRMDVPGMQVRENRRPQLGAAVGVQEREFWNLRAAPRIADLEAPRVPKLEARFEQGKIRLVPVTNLLIVAVVANHFDIEELLQTLNVLVPVEVHKHWHTTAGPSNPKEDQPGLAGHVGHWQRRLA